MAADKTHCSKTRQMRTGTQPMNRFANKFQADLPKIRSWQCNSSSETSAQSSSNQKNKPEVGNVVGIRAGDEE